MYYPIIYVRGYAGTQGEVEQTVDDPYYGFNIGSTHVRVESDERADMFFFESPLVRLMKDHEYRDTFQDGVARIDSSKADHPERRIWIHRYYDPTSETFHRKKGERLSIEDAAARLGEAVEQVQKQTGATKVILVAHSMGGLICRCLLQKIYPEKRISAADRIDKLFTYGTPHGGIHFDIGGGLLERARDLIGWNNSDDFGPQRMFEYLTPDLPRGKKKRSPPKDFDPRSLNNAFPADRVFCIVGTNARDYEVALGLSRTAVGQMSDGLVQSKQAYVHGSHRAYIHRSHSGRYGMVNSEEGYQNLQRFLFGDIQAVTSLEGIELPQDADTYYQAEVRIAVRGLPVALHEQSLAHYCPIPLKAPNSAPSRNANGGASVPLFTGFLRSDLSNQGDQTCRYTIRLAVHSFVKKERFLFGDHIEQVPLWTDYLIVDLTPTAKGGPADQIFSVRHSWLSDQRDPVSPPSRQEKVAVKDNGNPTGEVGLALEFNLPAKARAVLGRKARLRIETFDWE